MKSHTKQIMSRNLITIPAKASLREAYDLMQKKRIRHLPAVDDRKVIVGILSDRDLQRAMAPKIDSSPTRGMALEFDPAFKVEDFMSAPVQSVGQDMLVKDAAQRMLGEKVSMFLVVDLDLHPQGIITTDDMLKLLISLLEKDPTQSLGVESWMRENSMHLSYLD